MIRNLPFLACACMLKTPKVSQLGELATGKPVADRGASIFRPRRVNVLLMTSWVISFSCLQLSLFLLFPFIASSSSPVRSFFLLRIIHTNKNEMISIISTSLILIELIARPSIYLSVFRFLGLSVCQSAHPLSFRLVTLYMKKTLHEIRLCYH